MEKKLVSKFDAEKKGYPVNGIFWGRLTKQQMLDKVPTDYLKARLTGHNQVTRWYAPNCFIVRFRHIDVLAVFGDCVIVNCAGWYSVSTKRQIESALKQHGIKMGISFNKKSQTMEIFNWENGSFEKRGVFKKAAILYRPVNSMIEFQPHKDGNYKNLWPSIREYMSDEKVFPKTPEPVLESPKKIGKHSLTFLAEMKKIHEALVQSGHQGVYKPEKSDKPEIVEPF